MNGKTTATMEFPDNRLAALLFGECDAHLKLVEERLGVVIQPRGNAIAITADPLPVERARQLFSDLYALLEQGQGVDRERVEDGLRLVDQDARPSEVFAPEQALRAARRLIQPRGTRQAAYIASLKENDITFAVGPAGTGKTYLAVAAAIAAFLEGSVTRLILTRPAVEAGERLGFLPGDMQAKVDPYMRPLYDALYNILGAEKVGRMTMSGALEVAPIAYMRGRTLTEAFIILDEAQNTTSEQMKMFLTRMGEGSRMAVCGDITQIDLPKGQLSGLVEAVGLLQGVPGIGLTRFIGEDVVRHPLVRRIVDAYEQANAAARAAGEGK